MRLCLFEDRRASQLEPLALTRPVFALTCGMTTLGEKQRRHCGLEETGILVRPLLAEICRQDYPFFPCNDFDWLREEVTLLINGRWLPPLQGAPPADTPHVGIIGKQVAYAVVPTHLLTYCSLNTLDDCLQAWKQTLPETPAGGWMIDYPWELVEHNAAMIGHDFATKLARTTQIGHHPGTIALLGPKERLWVHETAAVEPQVVADTRRGPIIIDREAQVQAFTRLEGPCYIGPRSIVAGAKLRSCTIGPVCRVGGEVEASILHSHVNKYHEGFLGHSYVGEWVNIAAGVQVSDLRNDYQTVRMTVDGNPLDTGMQKIGSYIGDHTKIGLGTLLNTGSSIGVFSHLLPNGTYLPRRIPSFSLVHLGKIVSNDDLHALFITAAEVFSRRGWAWSIERESLFRALYHATAFERRTLHLRERRSEMRQSA
jgi:UDP-N-acetylglucosamine diphosphorylase / glucose-1-phosphate thymidylyltransferase / UDP-N-acetylgalactosamine diphosphorylase / glucosamine-1-phosphate N-acetyltransferase / galactosamine-1-phosphate N-acetyltransferase